jgi:hypothetical protein
VEGMKLNGELWNINSPTIGLYNLVGHEARLRKIAIVYNISLGKPQEKTPLVRHKRRWDDNIKIYFRGIVCGSVGWFQLAQERTQ